MAFQIKVVNITNYTQDQFPKLKEALSHFQHCINSDEFEDAIVNHPGFDTIDGFSNQQVYDIIMAGQELNSHPNRQADLDLVLELKISNDAVGYTIDTTIHTFESMFEAQSSAFLAGHYAHEYCHTLGFKDPDSLVDTSDNVPYEVGRIITELAMGTGLQVRITRAKKKAPLTKKKATKLTRPAAKKAVAKKKITAKPVQRKTGKKAVAKKKAKRVS